MYEKACKAIAKQQVALECLSYHSAASDEEVDRIKVKSTLTKEIVKPKIFTMH